MVNIKMLGISGTPVKNGNCDTLVKEALKAAAELEGVETEFISLAGKNIAMCTHCQWCIKNRKPCKVQDDAQAIWESMKSADAFIFGGPIWMRTLAPPLLILFSRMRYYTFISSETFRNKVVGAVTLGWFRHGADHALSVIVETCRSRGMIPVSTAAALASDVANGRRAAYMEHGVLDDKYGVNQVINTAVRVVEVTRMIKYAKEAGIATTEARSSTGGKFLGRKKEFVDGVWRSAEK